ncbi:ankyrin repeat domain-containing protein 33B-like [Leptonychotes weddellii]|uniref:Ankyrin repeat domain-containing protein 33B-like n=1 Tax=Leptonychotes weddellii TaxID=9713 RepID=A0A2U3XYV0_LEPWE|nr:ankyrin repeat domain-containing protein 33B-like [Leptonychotes weddellii]
MVLLAGPGPEGGGARRVSPQTPSPPRDALDGEDPADYEEYEDFSCLPDTHSIASDDSFYPVGGEEEYGTASAESVPEGVPEEATLLRAACANDVGLLRALVRRGPSAEEVQETDRNGRSRGDCAAAQRASWSLSCGSCGALGGPAPPRPGSQSGRQRRRGGRVAVERCRRSQRRGRRR